MLISKLFNESSSDLAAANLRVAFSANTSVSDSLKPSFEAQPDSLDSGTLDPRPLIFSNTCIPEPICLPDGSRLKWAHHWERGSQDKQWRDDFAKINQSPKSKEQHSILNCWGGGRGQVLICGDFDKHDGFSSFEALRTQLVHAYAGSAAIVESVSGKPKVFFPIQLPQGTSINTEIALANLEALLGEYFSIIDKKMRALSTSYINTAMITSLRNQLEYLPALPAYIPPAPVPPPEKGVLRYMHEGEMPEGFRFLCNKGEAIEKVLRFLLACHRLADETGWCLSSKVLGKSAGISQPHASRIIKRLVQAGCLIKLCDRFKTGKVAKRYRAAGALLKFLEDKKRERTVTLPTTIEDGEWNETLFRVSYQHFLFQPADYFIAWVRTIPGHDRRGKHRMRMALNTIRRQHAFLIKGEKTNASRNPK